MLVLAWLGLAALALCRSKKLGWVLLLFIGIHHFYRVLVLLESFWALSLKLVLLCSGREIHRQGVVRRVTYELLDFYILAAGDLRGTILEIGVLWDVMFYLSLGEPLNSRVCMQDLVLLALSWASWHWSGTPDADFSIFELLVETGLSLLQDLRWVRVWSGLQEIGF